MLVEVHAAAAAAAGEYRDTRSKSLMVGSQAQSKRALRSQNDPACPSPHVPAADKSLGVGECVFEMHLCNRVSRTVLPRSSELSPRSSPSSIVRLPCLQLSGAVLPPTRGFGCERRGHDPKQHCIYGVQTHRRCDRRARYLPIACGIQIVAQQAALPCNNEPTASELKCYHTSRV